MGASKKVNCVGLWRALSLYRIGDWGSRALWSQNAETPSSKCSKLQDLEQGLDKMVTSSSQGRRRGDNSTDRVCRAGPLSLNFTLDLRQKHVRLNRRSNKHERVR